MLDTAPSIKFTRGGSVQTPNPISMTFERSLTICEGDLNPPFRQHARKNSTPPAIYSAIAVIHQWGARIRVSARERIYVNRTAEITYGTSWTLGYLLSSV